MKKNKIKLNVCPLVVMKDGSYKNCIIRLAQQLVRISPDCKKKDDMGIVIIQPTEPVGAHPFTIDSLKLSELKLVAFR